MKEQRITLRRANCGTSRNRIVVLEKYYGYYRVWSNADEPEDAFKNPNEACKAFELKIDRMKLIEDERR